MHHLQQDLAGLTTAFLWSLSALAWSMAGRRVGSVAVWAIRIALAAVVLMAAHWVLRGRPWPTGIDGESLALMVASGVLGATVADLLLFRGLLLLGPRQGMLIMSLSPFMAALFALAMMRETLGLQAVAGITLTVGGIAWVLAEREGRRAWQCPPGDFRTGVLLCIAATVVVSIGYVLSRMGMLPGPRYFSAGGPRTGIEPLSATVIRVGSATAASWLALPLMGRLGRTLSAFRDRRAMAIVVAGTIVGPVVGIWMSMVALEGAKSGIAVALINTSPLMLIPIAYLAYGERPSWRTVGGTALAIAGVFLLILR
ncbi:MAG: hypothetical protein BIFFINMI_02499 [Phycisphaerae bacterium]|nr:hypothetical protein [Phycisphaerae bacterium]